MKAFSYWAKQHVWIARLLLIVAQTLLVFIAFFMGALFFDLILLDVVVLESVGLGLFFIGVILYPIKNTQLRFFKPSYVRRKSLDALLIISAVIIFFSVGVQFGQEEIDLKSTSSLSATFDKPELVLLVVHRKPINVSPKASKKMAKKERRFQRKQLRKELKTAIKQARQGRSGGEKALLTLLTLGLTCVLLYGVLILSCSLACSGMEVLAYMTVIGGTGLVITLAVILIKRIVGKAGKMQEL